MRTLSYYRIQLCMIDISLFIRSLDFLFVKGNFFQGIEVHDRYQNSSNLHC